MQRDFVIILGDIVEKNKYDKVNQVSCLKWSEDMDYNFIQGQARKMAYFLYHNGEADFVDELVKELAFLVFETQLKLMGV